MYVTNKELSAIRMRGDDIRKLREKYPLDSDEVVTLSVNQISRDLGLKIALACLRAVKGRSVEFMQLKISMISAVSRNLISQDSREALSRLESYFHHGIGGLDVDLILSLAQSGFDETLEKVRQDALEAAKLGGMTFVSLQKHGLAAEALVDIFERSVVSVYGKTRSSAEVDGNEDFLDCIARAKLTAACWRDLAP